MVASRLIFGSIALVAAAGLNGSFVAAQSPATCDPTWKAAETIHIDLTAASQTADGVEAALKSLRTRVCEAWVGHKQEGFAIIWTDSVDQARREDVRIVQSAKARMVVCVTERRRRHDFKFSGTGDNIHPEDVYEDETATRQFNSLEVTVATTSQLIESRSFDCSTLSGSRARSIRLINRELGTHEDW